MDSSVLPLKEKGGGVEEGSMKLCAAVSTGRRPWHSLGTRASNRPWTGGSERLPPLMKYRPGGSGHSVSFDPNVVGWSLCRLMEHEEDPDIDEPYVPPAENILGGNEESKPAPEEPTLADTAEGRGVALCLLETSV